MDNKKIAEKEAIKSLSLLSTNTSKSITTKTFSNFLQLLDIQIDDYSDLSFSPEEIFAVRQTLSHFSTGATAAIPLICGGPLCPFKERCPFMKIDAKRKKDNPDFGPKDLCTPIGKACLVETSLLNEWTKTYINEYDVMDKSFSELQIVRELAEIELLLWRINNGLAQAENSTMVQENSVGIDKQGNTITRREISAHFEVKERLSNRKHKLIKLMVGDRQEKYKKEAALKIKQEDDASSNAAQLRGQLNRLISKAKNVELKIKEAEGNVLSIDESSENPPQETSFLTENQELNPEDILID